MTDICCESNHVHNHTECHSDGHLMQIFVAVVIFIAAFFVPNLIKPYMFIAAYIVAGYYVLLSSLKNIIKGDIFDENFLMTIATIGALCIKEYPEAVMVMILFLLGDHFQDKAVSKARKSISSLINYMPEFANIEENGQIKQVLPQEVCIGSTIIIKPGEKIPLDGIIIQGNSQIDTSSLTGESLPFDVSENDEVLSGTVNLSGLLKVKVTKIYKDSAFSKILNLVENSSRNKSRAENYITKFAKIYTPIVVFCAVMLVLIPFIVQGTENIFVWINRALTFLVISCPCAFVISVPLTFYAGIGSASKNGILIKGGNFLELLSKTAVVFFDKTGTLTQGVFSVVDIIPDNINKDDLLMYAAYAESVSNHPIARSIVNYYGENIDNSNICDIEEFSGLGIKAKIFNSEILIGNEKLMNKFGIKIPSDSLNSVFVAKDSLYIGRLIVSDCIKDNTYSAVKTLKQYCIKIIMLTGDNNENTQDIAKQAEINEYYSKLLPIDKVVKIEEEISTQNSIEKSVIFVGDGINDAPAIMRADVGIAMGALGSDAAIEAADVVIADDNIEKVSFAIKISKHTMNIVVQNIVFAIGVKLLFLILGAFGYMTMWGAVFADVGVTLIAVLNSLRTLKTS